MADTDFIDDGELGLKMEEELDFKGGKFKAKDKEPKEAKNKGAKEQKAKVIKENAKVKKKGKKKKDLKFDTFIHRVLKQVHPQIGITKQAMSVMNDLVCNAFFQISEEAGKLVKMDNRDTMSARDINCAVRLILPGELAQHSNDEGQSALKHFEQNSKKG
mmetsp:Transcript_19250/g.48160  ORF Transcript_19250/g.48160 Transcript_19250/m.48160 type:complete len:160 (-) Transcript_19250:513-992(-)